MSKKIFIGIQSRLFSSRFPNKSFVHILGIPLIVRVIQRMQQIKHPHTLVLLVPKNEVSQYTQFLIQHHIDIPIFGGHPTNVLHRYYHAAKQFDSPDLIMRVTGDNPLLSPHLADLLIDYHLENPCDLSHFVKNTVGTGVEIFNFNALEKSYKEATAPDELEHVTQYIYKNRDLFHVEEPISPYISETCCKLSLDYIEDIPTIETVLTKYPDWDICHQ